MKKKVTGSSVKKEITTKDLGYTVGKWKKLPLYQCAKCSFNTLNKLLIEKHVAQYSVITPETPVIDLKVDRFGNKFVGNKLGGK